MSNDILLIDDEEKFAEMLQLLLSKHGYRAEYFLNPREALACLREREFGLVVSDFKMPQMNGDDFLVEARKVSPDLPVIMISGLMNMPELIKVANIGVTLALEKPFDTHEFLEHVARFVQPAEDPARKAKASAPAYPSPPAHMADESAVSRLLLEVLWENANRYRHLFVETTPDAETEALMKEILSWLGAAAETSVPCMGILDTSTAFTRKWLSQQDPFPPLTVVDLRVDRTPERILALTTEWIRQIEELAQDLSASRILYLLPVGFPFALDGLGLVPERKALVAPSAPALPALRERVADVAAYLRRELSAEFLAAMGAGERELLLQYNWPGGYEELRYRARQMQDAGARRLPQMREILGCGREEGADILSATGMAAFLKRRQREFIASHRHEGEAWDDLLLRFGLSSIAVSESEVRCEEALCFPELLQSDKDNQP
ncbi:MAG: response regulator [Verrucomicrobia bacterium]|jgi:CheY-like chemotaxis protein|nr:response regulator [Verrucomicrobiota bacterium]